MFVKREEFSEKVVCRKTEVLEVELLAQRTRVRLRLVTSDNHNRDGSSRLGCLGFEDECLAELERRRHARSLSKDVLPLCGVGYRRMGALGGRSQRERLEAGDELVGGNHALRSRLCVASSVSPSRECRQRA